jgi:hypothetical protein
MMREGPGFEVAREGTHDLKDCFALYALKNQGSIVPASCFMPLEQFEGQELKISSLKEVWFHQLSIRAKCSMFEVELASFRLRALVGISAKLSIERSRTLLMMVSGEVAYLRTERET